MTRVRINKEDDSIVLQAALGAVLLFRDFAGAAYERIGVPIDALESAADALFGQLLAGVIRRKGLPATLALVARAAEIDPRPPSGDEIVDLETGSRAPIADDKN